MNEPIVTGPVFGVGGQGVDSQNEIEEDFEGVRGFFGLSQVSSSNTTI